MERTRLLAVGACAIDTILTAPYYPEEDSKLRATSITKRRGGNCPNTLEVLNQLVAIDDSPLGPLYLLAVLPQEDSPACESISDSFDLPNEASRVSLRLCLHRPDHFEPVSSYIISSQATNTRTVVNHNDLSEMTFDEFKDCVAELLEVEGRIWFHFEGRIPETTLQCIRYLRTHAAFTGDRQQSLKISVELEKPKREGLQALAYEADVVFYSKSWAQAEGHESAEDCLKSQTQILGVRGHNAERTLVCTWGEQGCCAAVLRSSKLTPVDQRNVRSSTFTMSGQTDFETIAESSPVFAVPGRRVADTVGAGDTFIAGMLFALIARKDSSLRMKLDFANELAGRKVMQGGLRGLGEQMSIWVR